MMINPDKKKGDLKKKISASVSLGFKSKG